MSEIGKVTPLRAIRVKCKDCNGGLRTDCGVRACPLYSWNRYRDEEPDLSWAMKKERTEAQKAATEKAVAALRRLRVGHKG